MEATHKISAVYYPKSGEMDLTWEDTETGKAAYLTVKVSTEEGERVSDVVGPCVYFGATQR